MSKECGPGRKRLAMPRTRRVLTLVTACSIAVVVPTQLAFAGKAKPFVAGDATAISQALQIAPKTGGLSATLAIGTSIAQYRHTLAQASSQTLNLGVVGTTLTTQCDSTPPLFKANQLPQPLVAESTHGNAHAEKNTAGQGAKGLIAVAGHEAVIAKTIPAAIATFDGSALVLPGLLSASGLHSEGHSTLIPGKARVATASSEVGSISLLNGAIVLTGMKWTATQRGGTHHGQSSSFSLGGLSLAGKPLPVDQGSIESTFKRLNQLLAPTGIHITLPTALFQGGTLTENPLEIGINNSKLGGQIVNPILGALDPVTNPLRTALDGISCSFGKLFTVADLAAAAIDGTGGADVDFGGASANTDGKTYANPFGNQTLGGGHPLGNQGSSTSPPTTSPSGGGSVPSTNLPGTGSATTTPGGGTPQIAGDVTVSRDCSSTSPAHSPGCTDGQGLTVGLIALAAVGSIGAADFFVMRRRRRLPVVQL